MSGRLSLLNFHYHKQLIFARFPFNFLLSVGETQAGNFLHNIRIKLNYNKKSDLSEIFYFFPDSKEKTIDFYSKLLYKICTNILLFINQNPIIMKKNYASLVPFTAIRKNEFTVYVLLQAGNTEKMVQMLKDGLLLSAYCLTLMDIFGMDKYEIRDMVASAKRVQKDTFWWLKDRFTLEEIRGLLIKWKSRLPKRLLTDEERADLGMYNVLLKLERYDILAERAPKVLLYQIVHRTKDMFASAKALLEYDFNKYADSFFEKDLQGSFLAVEGGWKYLVNHGRKDFVLQNVGNQFAVLPPKEVVLAYCANR